MEIPEVLKRILSWPKSDQESGDPKFDFDGEQGTINQEARDQILGELIRLQDYLVNRSQRDIKGASILILVDHFSRSYTVKMIDLSTITIYNDPNARDEGLIKGVTTLIQFISKLQ